MILYYVVVAVSYFVDLSCAFPLETEYEAGYYWRNFNGKIPQDALPGGINPQGATTYIGQVYGKNLVMPAKIDITNDKISYEWGFQEHFATEDVKILCGKYPEQFQWLSTGNGYFNQLNGKHLIVAGHESGNNVYIGRIQLNDELSLGKVTNHTTQSTLHTTRDGVGHPHLAFQVLAYNPISNKKDYNDCQVVINLYN